MQVQVRRQHARQRGRRQGDAACPGQVPLRGLRER